MALIGSTEEMLRVLYLSATAPMSVSLPTPPAPLITITNFSVFTSPAKIFLKAGEDLHLARMLTPLYQISPCSVGYFTVVKSRRNRTDKAPYLTLASTVAWAPLAAQHALPSRGIPAGYVYSATASNYSSVS